MTFDDAESKADQEFELHPDSTGTLEYPTKYVFFYFKTNIQFFNLFIY